MIFTFQLDLKGTVHHCTDLKIYLLYYDTHGSSWLSCSLIFYCILYSPTKYSVDKEVTREQCIYKGRTVWHVVTYFNCNKLAYVKLRVVVEVILILCVCYNSQRSENTLCAFILSCHADFGNQALVVRLGIKCPHPLSHLTGLETNIQMNWVVIFDRYKQKEIDYLIRWHMPQRGQCFL